MATSKIFMDLKCNEYSLNGKIVSMALMDSDLNDEKILYLENSDYSVNDNGTWIPGITAVNNRLLTNSIPAFPSNVEAFYVPLSQFANKIMLWTNAFPSCRIYTASPLAWMFFVSIFGNIQNVPNNIEITPVFLPSIFSFKGFDPDKNIDEYVNGTKLQVLTENAVYDVINIRQAFLKVVK